MCSNCDVMDRRFNYNPIGSPPRGKLAAIYSSRRSISLHAVFALRTITFSFSSVVNNGRKVHTFLTARNSSCDTLRLCRSALSNGATWMKSLSSKNWLFYGCWYKTTRHASEITVYLFSSLNKRILTLNSGILSELLDPLALGVYSPWGTEVPCFGLGIRFVAV